MAHVPLDGIRIDLPHHLAAGDVLQEMERFAQDLAENRFPHWGIHLERVDGRMLLRGGHDGSRFEARVTADGGRIVLDLAGVIEIGLFKLGLAGGPDGVRERVRSTLAETLRAHLGSG